MIPGVIPHLTIGVEEHLQSGKDDEFPVALNQWQMVANLLKDARGAVIAKPERVRPLWLTLRNETNQTLPLAWVYYRICLKTGLDDDTVIIKADVPMENIPANSESRVGLLDIDAWNFVKAEVIAVSPDRLLENPADDAKPEVSLTHQVVPRDLWVVVYCPTGATFTRPAQVTFDLPQENAKVRFRQPSPRETLCVTKHHNLPGLIAVVEMPQRSGDLLGHAFEAQTMCDGVVSSAFALTLADMRESFPVLVCDATAGLEERPFVHFFADQLVMGRRALLDPKQWSDQASGVFNQSSKRVVRAIRWLRKMHTEDDILDRFLAGWTGLETLNPELCKHFGVSPTGEDIRECGKCGEKLVRNVPRATGLKELFVREGKEAVYSDCSPARNGLVHGFQALGELTALARTHTSDVGLMLAKGIQILSGIPISTDPERFKWLNGFRVASFLFFEGTIRCGELAAYENHHNELPLLEFTLRHEGVVIDEKTVLDSEANISPPPGCSLSMKGMGVSGPVTITKLQAKSGGHLR
jgi:hypothetical protein